MDHDKVSIHFLDVHLYSQGGQTFVSLYRKPMSGNSILRAESCHPNHVIRNLSIGEYVRARRTYSFPEDYIKETHTIDNRLQQRGYTKKILFRVKNIVDSRDRSHYLFSDRKAQMTSKDTTPTFVISYSRNYNIINIDNRYLPILYQDSGLEDILGNGVRFSARRAKSLGIILSLSLLKSDTQTTWLECTDFYKCGQKRCGICRYAKQSKTFAS